MRLRDVVEQQDLRLLMLTGDCELDRGLAQVYTTDLLDSGRYLTGDEMVLTGLMWWRDAADSERFVEGLSKAGVAALGAGEALLGAVPDDLVEACRRHRMPLFAVPEDISFREITDRVNSLLWAEREAAAITTRSHQRGRVSALAAGAELADVWPTDTEAWVLTCTGRVVAGSPLPVAGRLARAFLRAGTLPAQHTVAGRAFQLAELPGVGRLGGRFVAASVTSDYLDELVQLAALDHAQHARVRQVECRLATQLAEQLAGQAPPADVAAALHACRLRPTDRHLVLAAAMTSGQPADTILEELLHPYRAAVGGLRDLTVAVVPTDDPAAMLTTLRAAAASLQTALRHDLLAIGISEPVVRPTGLPAALTSARHALGYALRRSGPDRVLSSGALASHELLMANVPQPVREAFAEQLLAPLRAYDGAHQAELVRTLDTFLRLDGSWSRCASSMHLHVNTLRYRLRRIETLTGRDLDRFVDRVDFYLALRQGEQR
jgi:hypothetical protein